ncbi:PTS mannose transporter subunit IIC, partial [Lactiplantibacillus plantarum]
MSVILARVDQRLIHGLIVNQWAQALQVNRLKEWDKQLPKSCKN